MKNTTPLIGLTHVDHQSIKDVSKAFDEIQIRVPWGYLAGKWYGPKNIRPIVGLHGWQDNAGTFDTLAPLLPSHIGFLSLDLPGHGLSSRLPDGIFYDSLNNLHVLRIVMKEYNWEKISLIGHSISSATGFLFAAVFPDKIDMFIALDLLTPPTKSVLEMPELIARQEENFIIADGRNRDETSEPPSYTYDKLIEKLHFGTAISIDKDKCHYLLARSIQKSKNYPDQYFFTRDSRLKSFNYHFDFQELRVEFAKCVIAPHLFIKACDSPYFEEKKYFYEALEILKQNPKFEFYEVKGTHHVHLNNPERISEIINAFINKYRPPEVSCKL